MSQRRNDARTDGRKVAERGEKERVSDRWSAGVGAGVEEEMGLWKTEAAKQQAKNRVQV